MNGSERTGQMLNELHGIVGGALEAGAVLGRLNGRQPDNTNGTQNEKSEYPTQLHVMSFSGIGLWMKF